MTTTCPNGHDSEWPDWCSVCGENLGGAAAVASSGSSPANGPASAPDAPSGSTSPPDAAQQHGPPCPNCSVSTHPDDAFCENCGYDFASGTLPDAGSAAAEPTSSGQSAPAAAEAEAPAAPRADLAVTVTVDADFFAATTAEQELALPDPLPEVTQVTLTASRNLVGRTSQSRGILPEIDIESLTGDPGVSSRHLMFERAATGQWTFTDLGSTNGTYLSTDADATPIDAGPSFPIGEVMSLWLGAWTRLDLSVEQ